MQMRSAAHIKAQIEEDIGAAGATVVVVGPTTERSSRVSFEIRTARGAGHRIVGRQHPDAEPRNTWSDVSLVPWSLETLEAWLDS